MAQAMTVRDVWSDGRRVHLLGTIVFSGNYAAGGEAIDLKTLPQWKTSRDPDMVLVNGKAGFQYVYDRVAKKIMVFTNSAGGANAALTEHTAAAYAAGVTGDTVEFYAVGKKLI